MRRVRVGQFTDDLSINGNRLRVVVHHRIDVAEIVKGAQDRFVVEFVSFERGRERSAGLVVHLPHGLAAVSPIVAPDRTGVAISINLSSAGAP